ncbi:MAG TPA: thiamine ABC transporter substrate-binding protein [Deltaproteobacteria bacterium]|nr:thiamine ABC transporter substrate-binding protein [Deltaproteobacteria bacterium]
MNRPLACIFCLVSAAAMCLSAGCTREERSEAVPTLTVMTHDSFKVSENVVKDFEGAFGCKVTFLKAGDAGSALNQTILSKKNPLSDVFFGIDNTFMGRALKEDLFEPYRSPMLRDIPDDLKLDRSSRLLPVDFGDVCLNYDKAWFARNDVAPPATLEDLTEPAYRGLLVVENPATSSPGLAFLLATIGHFGEDGYLEYWKRLRSNGVFVTAGWEDAYWGQFSAASKGTRPIVVSYASSPPAEVHFSKEPLDESPTAVVAAPGTAFRQVEFVGIVKGTRQPALARKWVDYMLDIPFQEDIPLQMFMFPANSKAVLPDVFRKHAAVPREPVIVAPERISSNREAWIEAWTDTVLR